MSCWTQALHEYVLTSPPQGIQEEAARALLCTPRKTNEPVGLTIGDPLRQWLAQSPILSDAYALSSALPYTEDFHRLGGPLLVWGMSQPWRADIQITQTLTQWCAVLNQRNRYSNALADNMAYATRLVAQLLPHLEEDARRVASRLWTKEVVEASPHNLLWKLNMYDAPTHDRAVKAWADLHTIAATFQELPGSPMTWEKSVRRAFSNCFLRHDRCVLALLESALPDDAKIRAACAANFKVWLDPTVFAQLAPFLQHTAPDPAVRIYSLAWASKEQFPNAQEYAHMQKRLCSLYCPELVPLFELCAINWFDRISVFRAASAFTPSSESLDVAGLLDEAPGLS